MKQLVILFVLSMLVACTGRASPDTGPLPDFAPAIMVQDTPSEVKIIEVPKPLALPGQMKKLPAHEMDVPEKEDPEQSIMRVQEKALWQPGEGRYFNAIQTYPYSKGALYQLYAAPNHVTDIRLEAGENLKSISAGDTIRWVIGDTVSGAGEAAVAHILVKPIESGLTTNLVIITDRRSYHLELKSLEATYMAALAWSYPHRQIQMLKQQNAEARARIDAVAGSMFDLDNLNFAYRITGDRPDWRPYRAFDDGRKVYIEFPRNIGVGEAPPLFVVGVKGQVELVNYRMRGRYYVVDRLFRKAELRLGEDPQQKVMIERRERTVYD